MVRRRSRFLELFASRRYLTTELWISDAYKYKYRVEGDSSGNSDYRYTGLRPVMGVNIRPNSRPQSGRNMYPHSLRPGVGCEGLE